MNDRLSTDIKQSTLQPYIEQVESVLYKARETGDIMEATKWAAGILLGQRITGTMLVKFFGEMRHIYLNYPVIDELVGEEIPYITWMSEQLNYSTQTIRKYVDAWDYILDNIDFTEASREAMTAKPVEQLILTAPAAKADQLEQSHIDQIVNSTSKAEVRDIIKKARGGSKTSGKTALSITFEREGSGMVPGRIMCKRQGDETWKHVGLLHIEDEDRDIQAAIHRIVNAAGLMEANG